MQGVPGEGGTWERESWVRARSDGGTWEHQSTERAKQGLVACCEVRACREERTEEGMEGRSRTHSKSLSAEQRVLVPYLKHLQLL